MAELLIGYGALPAHDLLRALAARFHGIDPDRVVLGHTCPRCGSDDHGRPLLLPTSSLRTPAQVSLARAGALSIAAVTDAGSVGVDVEVAGAAAFDGFAEVALHVTERAVDASAATAAWVRKEALLKAAGVGLAVDPREVRIEADGTVSWGQSLTAPDAVLLRDLAIPGHTAAVAVLATDAASLEDLEPMVSRW